MSKQEIIQKIKAILQKHGIEKASLFGSVLREDFSQNSDIDILVESFPDNFGLFDIFDLRQELEKATGRKIDLLEKQNIRKHFKPYILNSTEVLYK